MQETILSKLRDILGCDDVITEREQMLNYLVDETLIRLCPQPAADLVLIKPKSAQEISNVMRLANELQIPVFPRGGGTGLVGGAVPTRNGIILSLERMDKIEIDTANMMAIAEAGVTLGKLGEAAAAADLTFPPHPGDENAQIGGLVATNAGGSRAVKHGIMRNQIRELEIVMPTGEIIHLGRRVHKNNVGYDLMQLIIGSEGTLAVITKATLQLYAKPGAQLTLIIPYDNPHDAISCVPLILREGITPLAVEYVELDMLKKAAEHLGARWPVTHGNCCLLIILEATNRDELLSQGLAISKICRQHTRYEVFAAEPANEQSKILRIRSEIYTALKGESMEILDITVPIAELEHVIDAISKIVSTSGTAIPVLGHAADGNLHVHISKAEGKGMDYVEDLKNEIYTITMNAGGVVTGEHGIGKIRLDKLSTSLSSKELALLREIKKIFDPRGILNPDTKLIV